MDLLSPPDASIEGALPTSTAAAVSLGSEGDAIDRVRRLLDLATQTEGEGEGEDAQLDDPPLTTDEGEDIEAAIIRPARPGPAQDPEQDGEQDYHLQ